MLGYALVSAATLVGAPYTPSNAARPIDSLPDYPPGMADDVRRPGFNGRLWVTRPILGALSGPYAEADYAPGREAYGAYLDTGSSVPARVGLLTIHISPWAAWTPQGHRDLEHARSFWLQENGYTGGVRTHVNDYYLFRELYERQTSAPREVSKPEKPEPAAIIELSPDAPRHKNRLRVNATPRSNTAAAAILQEQGAMRISWPHNAPAAAVAITGAHAGHIQGRAAQPVITAAR
jgi:hypothetical protein